MHTTEKKGKVKNDSWQKWQKREYMEPAGKLQEKILPIVQSSTIYNSQDMEAT